MRIFVVAVVAFVTLLPYRALPADQTQLSKLGKSVNLDAKAPAANITPAMPRPGHEAILCGLAIEPSYGSSPPSYLLSGRVKSDNTGMGLERIAIFVGPESVAPRLAAMTNADGDFKFRLWIKEDDRKPSLSVPPDFSGYLYVGGHPSLTYRNRLRLMSGYSIRYKLSELAEAIGAKIVVNPQWQSYGPAESNGEPAP